MGYTNAAVLTAKSVRRRQGGTEAAKGPVLHAGRKRAMNEGAAKVKGRSVKAQNKRQPLPVYDPGEWRGYGKELDACTRDYPTRTPYFYRREAVKWWRNRGLFRGYDGAKGLGLALDFARIYLRRYREVAEQWADITAGIVKSDGIIGVLPSEAARAGWWKFRKGSVA